MKDNLFSIVMYGARQCNGICAYCCSRASNNINKEKDNIIIDEGALVTAIRKHPRRIDRFQLWGTEPLLHLKEFKQLVDILHKHCPDKQIQSSTNGTLLCDKDIADYLIENNIRMQFSHDGPAQHLRTPFDPATNENVIRLAKKRLLFINTVTHEFNKDVKAIIDYWDNWKETYDIPDINIRISIPMMGDNGIFEIKDLDDYFAQLDKYWNHPYLWHIRLKAEKYNIKAGMTGCKAFARGLRKYSNQIDTLGRYTKCNLLDSSQEPSNPKGTTMAQCYKCKYRSSDVCNTCVSLPHNYNCNYLYRLNEFLEAKHKLIEQENNK